MVAYKGNVLASDMTGGFYSFKYDDSPLALCADGRKPRSVFSRKRSTISATRIVVRGNASRPRLQRDADHAQAPGQRAPRQRVDRAQGRQALPVRLGQGRARQGAQLRDAAVRHRAGARSAGAVRCAAASRPGSYGSRSARATARATPSARRPHSCGCTDSSAPPARIPSVSPGVGPRRLAKGVLMEFRATILRRALPAVPSSPSPRCAATSRSSCRPPASVSRCSRASSSPSLRR